MRKINLYIKIFKEFIILIIILIAYWFFLLPRIGTRTSELVSTIFGVAVSLSFAIGVNRIIGHKRRKKALGLLSLTTVSYLRTQADDMLATMQAFHDICSIEQATTFLKTIKHLNRVAESFDTTWIQPLYSQDFIDLIDTDEIFGGINNLIRETLIFIRQLTSQSINAELLFFSEVELSNMANQEKIEIIRKSREIREQLQDVAGKLNKYNDTFWGLAKDILEKNGATYSEIPR